MPWEPPSIETNEDAVTGRVLDGMGQRMDGWVAVEGAPEVALGEELGREIATLNQNTSDILAVEAAAGIGQTAFRFPAFEGASAQIEVDLTLIGPGQVIPAGFTVVGTNDNGDEVSFELVTDTGAPEATVHVTMTALIPGDIGNGVPAGPLEILTATTAVVAAAATATSTNGADPEPLETYLDRLVDYLGTLRPGGVNGDDLAALARSVPGVHRALGIDLYDPDNPGTPSERTVTVFPVDETSHPVDADTKAQVQQVLEDAREINFIVHVADPTYTPIDLAFDAVAEIDANPATVVTEVTAALAGWLTAWGATSTDEQAWVPTNTVRLLDAVRVAGSAPGVAYLNSLTINGGTADVALPGVAAMPSPLDAATPSTITGTAS